MAYFEATGWNPAASMMTPAPPSGPDPITSTVNSIIDWFNSKAPPAPPAAPAPSTSTMMTVASAVTAPPPPKPAAPMAKPGLSTGVKLAIGAGAIGLIYLAVR